MSKKSSKKSRAKNPKAKNLPADLRGVRPEGADHSVWELVEHLRTRPGA